MNTRKKTHVMTMTALLTAIAILIPIVMPFQDCHSTCFLYFGSHIVFLLPCSYRP